ncbi:MAG: hypothetical protein IKQ36_05280 [Clostridia bacterium]|nr:hypothetical protein [Clostridia bacterium]
MKRLSFSIIVLLIIAAVFGCNKSGEIPSNVVKPSSQADLTSEVPAKRPEPVKTELPDDFYPRERDYADRAEFGNVSYTLEITDPMTLQRSKDGDTETVAFGSMLNEPFPGKTEKGFYVCTGKALSGRKSELEPSDSLFFFDAETERFTVLGKALNLGVLADGCIVGVRYEPDPENANAETIAVIRHDLKDDSQTELMRIRVEDIRKEGDYFYAKWFGGDELYFTLLYGMRSTDYGVHLLNVRTGECKKITESGLPLGLAEDGALLYGDF